MLRILFATALAFAAMSSAAHGQYAPHAASLAVPNPAIRLIGIELYSAGGGEFLRHRFEVTNRGSIPAEIFAAAPHLPPCGTNTTSARTWVDFFDGQGKRLYGFCALAGPGELDKIWFAVPKGTRPPATIYIELHDRQTGSKYRSNLASTAFY